MSLAQLLCFAPLFSLPSFVLGLLGQPRRAGLLTPVGPAALFLVGLAWVFSGHDEGRFVVENWAPFLPDAALRLTVDGLAGVMLLVVGGVASCVAVYAQAYMHEDKRQHRFFAFLDLFVMAMCLLIVAGNLSVLLIGWTGVGISSFLLISFWWHKPENLRAGFMALGANAIGDAALLAACVLVPSGAGALSELHTVSGSVPGGATALGMLIVVAAAAKSAQGPLWWWLPSAMAGPTPVSALIHAATMVAAGVYLLVRTSPLLQQSEVVMHTVAITGLATAILGGVASLWQPNFKRGLAYSTVSQLGWMFAAVGVGAPFAALFHLVTHASFKAMLFLAAGTVIHACHHEEMIAKVGGLKKALAGAHAFFLIGSLCLIGTPFLSGSFSKDAILEGALHGSTPLYGWLLLASTLLTGAYTGRLYFGIFHGKQGDSAHHAHAPGLAFDGPLIPLALGAVVLGYIEAGTHGLSSLLSGSVAAMDVHLMPTALGLGAFAIGAVGFALGGALALKTTTKSIPLPPLGALMEVVHEFTLVPRAFSSLHGGRVGRYIVVGLVGAALLLLFSQRPVEAKAPSRIAQPFAASVDVDRARGSDDARGRDGARGKPGLGRGKEEAREAFRKRAKELRMDPKALEKARKRQEAVQSRKNLKPLAPAAPAPAVPAQRGP